MTSHSYEEFITQLGNGKREILFSSELYKDLAATVLGGIFVLYLSFSAQKRAEITDTKLKIGVIVYDCLVF